MLRIRLSLLSALLSAVLFVPALPAQLARQGRLLFAEDFRTPAVYTKEFQPAQPGWRVRAWHQDWVRTPEGYLASKWTTGHMPVIAFEGELTDFVVELEFRFTKIAGQKAVCRVSALNPALDPRAYAVSVWANADSAERPLGLVLERDVWKPGTITTVARESAEFASGTWYTLRLEVVGDRAWATCNGRTVQGRHEKFALPKTVLAIGTGHCPHEIRGLRVYAATANPAFVPPAANP